MTRFPIRFDTVYSALSRSLLLSPSDSYLEVEDDEVRVRMAWAFRAKFLTSAIVSVAAYDKKPISRGVHGWAGRWLVNGSGDGILRIDLEPTQRGYVMGFPVRLRNLLVSVEDPVGVTAALTR